MIGRRCTVIALGGLLLLVLTVNIYFVRMIIEDSPQKSIKKNIKITKSNRIENDSKIAKVDIKINDKNDNNKNIYNVATTTINMEKKIRYQMKILSPIYRKKNLTHVTLIDRLLTELKILPTARNDIWNIPHINWPDADHLIPPVAPELGTILNALRKADIIKADNALLGTQLKFMLTLSNGVKALFKPMWYSRDAVLKGPVYHGKDRHNAEIVAFHLSSLLSLRRVPLCTIRKLKIEEDIKRHATPELLNTIYQEGNETCIYGVCHYCSPSDPVCGKDNFLEGAMILWLPKYLQLSKHRHPWQRTYKRNKLALWEVDDNYCKKVKESKSYSIETSSRLLDLVDTAIFDFIMDNGDRHHYEIIQSNFHNPAVLLIDNGKSLGNPYIDHIDIIAPLYQCCLIHKKTWDRLKLLSGGTLSKSLKKLLDLEANLSNVSRIVNDDHLKAMDRRLLIVFSTVEICIKENNGVKNVIFDHR